MSDWNAIVLELRSHRQEFKALNLQISEVHISLENQLSCKVEWLERLIAKNLDELKAELDRKAKQIQDNIDLDKGQHSARIDNMEVKLNEAKSPVTKFQPRCIDCHCSI